MSTNDKLSKYGFKMLNGSMVFAVERTDPLWNEKSKYAVLEAEYIQESDSVRIRKNNGKYKLLPFDNFIKKYKLEQGETYE